MARTAEKLTAKFVAKNDHKPNSRHSDGRGLYLHVSEAGGKSWVLLYTLNNKRRSMGLGSAEIVTLQEAREKAREAARLVADGIDPINARKGESFYDLAKTCVEKWSTDWKSDKTADAWLRTLDLHGGVLKTIAVNKITPHIISEVVGEIWVTKPSVAQLLLQIIRKVYDYARVKGAVPIASVNPATYKGTLEHLLTKKPKAKHLSSMHYREVPAFMVELRATSTRSSAALQFIILTGLRKHEALKTVWSEIDFDSATLTVPAERMKMGREHIVPLSTAALELLRSQFALTGGEPTGFVFPARANGGAAAGHLSGRTLDDRVPAPNCVHGMRTSLRQYLGSETDTPFEVAEDILSHAVGNQVTRSYLREQAVEKARVALQKWSDYLEV